MASFKRLINDLSWDNVYTQTNSNCAYKAFMESFNSIFNKCFPLVTAKKQSIKVNSSKPWFTPGLQKSSKKKQTL